MKKADFSEISPGKVIETLHGYISFIPNPLPPILRWSSSIITALSSADRSLARLSEAGNAFPVPHLVMRPFIRKEAVFSSQIEGTRTSFQELMLFEARQLSFFGDTEDAREVHNYVKALDYGLRRLDSLPLSKRLICEIHGVLMEGVRGEVMNPGEFRRSQNWIGRAGAAIENARYVPPPVEELYGCLSALERFIHENTEMPPLIKIALIHYQFEAIHPFMDGNGRIGRLLITLLMVAWGLLPQPLLYLSNFIEANRQEYYDRLLAVSKQGEWEAWLLYFLEGVHSQAEDARLRITRLHDLRKKYHALIARERNRVKLERLLDYLIGTPITTINQAVKELGMGSFTTIQRYVEKLCALGVLREVSGKERNRIYLADEILRALEE